MIEGYKLCSQVYKLRIEFIVDWLIVYMLPLVAVFSYANSKSTHNLCFCLCIMCFSVSYVKLMRIDIVNVFELSSRT